jgi:predicted Fe-Mo cluster-binding NifX family protein
VIISGGMGQRAQQLFAQHNIDVCVGVNAEEPARLVEQYLNGQLRTGENLCDH